jgi:hypothetical protein
MTMPRENLPDIYCLGYGVGRHFVQRRPSKDVKIEYATESDKWCLNGYLGLSLQWLAGHFYQIWAFKTGQNIEANKQFLFYYLY